MTHSKITIRIEEDKAGLPFDAFADVVCQTVSILRDIDRSMSIDHSLSARWFVAHVSMQSPLEFTVAPIAVKEDIALRDAISPFLKDAESLECGKPAQFLTVGQQQRLNKIVGALNKGIRSISFSSNGTTVRTTQRVAATITETLGAIHYEIGSIEGKLDVISVHGCDSIKVWDHRYNVAVLCHVSDIQLEEAKNALGRRVVVRGRIKTIGGKPQAIVDVYDIRPLRNNADLPQPDQIGPINLFGDKEPADFLRGLPDGE